MRVQNRVGPPVRGDDLFGRDAFVDLVWEKLDSTHILLAAPRRFGKTSVMYRLIDEGQNPMTARWDAIREMMPPPENDGNESPEN